METLIDGVIATALDDEVWYRIEFSFKGEDDWSVDGSRTFDTMIAANCAIDRGSVDGTRDTEEFDFRIVRVTTKTESVRYA